MRIMPGVPVLSEEVRDLDGLALRYNPRETLLNPHLHPSAMPCVAKSIGLRPIAAPVQQRAIGIEESKCN